MKICAICEKKSALAGRLTKLRGKYNPAGKHRQHPNLQWVHINSRQRVLACSKCIKSLSKTNG